jgi:hypothetical protein
VLDLDTGAFLRGADGARGWAKKGLVANGDRVALVDEVGTWTRLDPETGQAEGGAQPARSDLISAMEAGLARMVDPAEGSMATGNGTVRLFDVEGARVSVWWEDWSDPHFNSGASVLGVESAGGRWKGMLRHVWPSMVHSAHSDGEFLVIQSQFITECLELATGRTRWMYSVKNVRDEKDGYPSTCGRPRDDCASTKMGWSQVLPRVKELASVPIESDVHRYLYCDDRPRDRPRAVSFHEDPRGPQHPAGPSLTAMLLMGFAMVLAVVLAVALLGRRIPRKGTRTG